MHVANDDAHGSLPDETRNSRRAILKSLFVALELIDDLVDFFLFHQMRGNGAKAGRRIKALGSRRLFKVALA